VWISRLGIKNGLIGTLGISHSEQYSEQTTPDILTLYRTLDGYRKDGIKTAVPNIIKITQTKIDNFLTFGSD
jgi:UDP-N-acetylmuramoyl-L-alanyl-D-glutamate--2,6-diaminopimelate ligase